MESVRRKEGRGRPTLEAIAKRGDIKFRNAPASSTWNGRKCLSLIRALKAGLPFKNACGRAKLPYYATIIFLQHGAKRVNELALLEVRVLVGEATPEEVAEWEKVLENGKPIEAELYEEVQYAISDWIYRQLRKYDKGATAEDHVKHWSNILDRMKRVDPDTWNIVSKVPTTTVNINNENNAQQANVPLPAAEVKLIPTIASGEEWNGKALPARFEPDMTLDEVARLEGKRVSANMNDAHPRLKAVDEKGKEEPVLYGS